VNIFALKFGTHVINIEMILCKKFHDKKAIFSPWEGVKVGSTEISIPANSKTPF